MTLTAGDAIDTFSWSAPNANGLPITKYGYQTTTNNGSSWNTEVEVSSASAVLSTQYSTSTFRIRVRAFNAAGWGDYSTISTDATVAWVYTDYISQTVTENQACSSVGCGDCGTQAQQKTRSKEQRKYRYTRSGSTSGPYDTNWSDYTSYPDWSTISCANTGSCAENTGTWSNIAATTVNGTQTIDGLGYTVFQVVVNGTGNVNGQPNVNGTGVFYVYRNVTPQGCQDYGCGPPFTGDICSCWDRLAYQLQSCSTTGKIRAVEVGCRQYANNNSCGGGGGS